MYNLFKEQNHRQVSYALYYSVFCGKFNLSFSHPAKDLCATCVRHKLRMKDRNVSEEERKVETAMFILHRRQSRFFYDHLNFVEQSCTVSFDMMQNSVLPKTAIGQAYYSRQLYLYVLGIVVHHGKGSHQTKDDVHLYVWLEHQNRKGSNMTASALQHCLTHCVPIQIKETGFLRLFSDSCYGQNKNVNLLAMLFALRHQIFKNLKIEYTFPIRGHSFLPADKVFGRIGQNVKKIDNILLPEEYFEILRQHGTVHVYGKSWHCFDFKTETEAYIKAKRTFKISEAKGLQITSDKLSFKTTYSGEFCEHTLLKKSKHWVNFKPDQLPMRSTVTEAKKKDVRNLLIAIGAPDHVMGYYEDALATTGIDDNDSDDD